jgi:ribonuclease HI
MLYYSGFKRAPLIRKSRGLQANEQKMIEVALSHLGNDLKDDAGPVGVRIIAGASGKKLARVNTAVLPAPLITREQSVYGEDAEVLSYLFAKAPNGSPESVLPVAKSLRVPLPMESSFPVSVSSDTVIMAADASCKLAPTNGGKNAAGTGWVVEFHDEAGVPVIEVGSRHYADREYGHAFGSNTFEMYAVRDALKHLLSMTGEHLNGVSRVVLFSDSTYVVRALMERDDEHLFADTVEDIHRLIADVAESGITVDYMWTKGHAGNRWNVMADQMAAIGRQSGS